MMTQQSNYTFSKKLKYFDFRKLNELHAMLKFKIKRSKNMSRDFPNF